MPVGGSSTEAGEAAVGEGWLAAMYCARWFLPVRVR